MLSLVLATLLFTGTIIQDRCSRSPYNPTFLAPLCDTAHYWAGTTPDYTRPGDVFVMPRYTPVIINPSLEVSPCVLSIAHPPVLLSLGPAPIILSADAAPSLSIAVTRSSPLFSSESSARIPRPLTIHRPSCTSPVAFTPPALYVYATSFMVTIVCMVIVASIVALEQDKDSSVTSLSVSATDARHEYIATAAPTVVVNSPTSIVTEEATDDELTPVSITKHPSSLRHFDLYGDERVFAPAALVDEVQVAEEEPVGRVGVADVPVIVASCEALGDQAVDASERDVYAEEIVTADVEEHTSDTKLFIPTSPPTSSASSSSSDASSTVSWAGDLPEVVMNSPSSPPSRPVVIEAMVEPTEVLQDADTEVREGVKPWKKTRRGGRGGQRVRAAKAAHQEVERGEVMAPIPVVQSAYGTQSSMWAR